MKMDNQNIPSLKHYEGSWIIVNRISGLSVCEIFKGSKLINNINYDKYKAVPAQEYLSDINKKIKQKED